MLVVNYIYNQEKNVMLELFNFRITIEKHGTHTKKQSVF